MDVAGLVLVITTIVGAISSGVALIRTGRTEKLKNKVDDTATAFNVLDKTVQTLGGEVTRLSNELSESRKETDECEKGRKELAKVVGEQATEISEMKKKLENLVSGPA